MPATVTLKDENIVKDVCGEIVNDSKRSNFVRVGNLSEHKDILNHFSSRYKVDSESPNYMDSNGGVNIAVGTVLTNAPWASRWTDGVYQIDTDIV